MENWLTLEQCAKLFDLPNDKIKRSRSGEIYSEKRVGKFGQQWHVNAEKVDKVLQEGEVVPEMRNVSVIEFDESIQKVILNVVHSEVMPLYEEIRLLNYKLDKQERIIQNQYQLIYEKLKALSELKEKPKSFWQRLFE